MLRKIGSRTGNFCTYVSIQFLSSENSPSHKESEPLQTEKIPVFTRLQCFFGQFPIIDVVKDCTISPDGDDRLIPSAGQPIVPSYTPGIWFKCPLRHYSGKTPVTELLNTWEHFCDPLQRHPFFLFFDDFCTVVEINEFKIAPSPTPCIPQLHCSWN